MRKYSVITDVGNKIAVNQDNYFVGDNWCIVADGMGGHKGGEVASKAAIEIIKKGIKQQSFGIEALLKNVIIQENRAIYDMSLNDPELEGMGTTAVLCYFEDKTAYIAHVGDSRAYHLSDDTFVLLTIDLSLVQNLIESGTITPQEAKNHPQKNLITRAIGTDSTIEVDICKVSLKKGDYIMLCTDGLTSFLSDSEIKTIIKTMDSDEAVTKLVDMANSNGGTDNITIVLILV